MSEAADLVVRIRRQARWSPERVALVAEQRAPLHHAALWRQADELGAALRSLGLQAGDCVALVMPDGPEMLAAFLAVQAVCACAPLHPQFQEPELDAALTAVRARAVLVQAGALPSALALARRRGLPVIEAHPEPQGPAGAMKLRLPGPLPLPAPPRFTSRPALLLLTSGTTGQPKLVPLTHQQLDAMVQTIRDALPEADAGRFLVLLPQCHLHCLLSVLVQLYSGGAIGCTGGYRPESFVRWMRQWRPTQYTANPTLHRAILSLATQHAPSDLFAPLRFVSSLGAALPGPLHAALEQALGVPVVEGYGLTEAGRVTMTALDPGDRRSGSAGRCVGPEVAILGQDGTPLPSGAEGEIALRGPTVITGYADGGEEAFQDGWFRTGDLGRLDEDGFLFITGRLKELINRGTEKILPDEVEAALCGHPAVLQAAVFAVPHPRLGEDVAAAVVVRPGARAAPPELRAHAAQRLAPFKVPRRILLVQDLPRGPTGKLQRIGLAAHLGVGRSSGVPPRPAPPDPLEAEVAELWKQLLAVPEVLPEDDFFELGGDSLAAAEMVSRLEAAFQRRLGLEALVEDATLAGVSARLRQARADLSPAAPVLAADASLVPLRPAGHRPPLFLVHALEGGVLFYRNLIRHLPAGLPVYAFRAPAPGQRSFRPQGFTQMARSYVAALRRLQPQGPYRLGGYSLGGVIATEMARQLRMLDAPVEALFLLDSSPPRTASLAVHLGRRLVHHARALATLTHRHRAAYLRHGVQALLHWVRARAALAFPRRAQPSALASPDAEPWMIQAARSHRCRPLALPGLLVCCRDQGPEHSRHLIDGWTAILGAGLEVREVPGLHVNVMEEPAVQAVAAALQLHLARLDADRLPSL